MADKVFTKLRGTVKTDEGVRVIKRGEPLPKNAAGGERERLERLGALGTLGDAVAEQVASTEPAAVPFDINAADAAALVEHIRTGNDGKALIVDDTVALAAGDRALAERVLAAETEANGGEPRATVSKQLQAILDAE